MQASVGRGGTVPYRVLRWPLISWRRRFVPWRVRKILNRSMNFVGVFNHLERSRAEALDDPMENLLVPAAEGFALGGIWVTDFFPPSMYSQLQENLRRNGWEQDRTFGYSEGSKAQQVWRARRGRGFAWSRIASVANPGSGYIGVGIREKLPKEFDFVEISAVQIGRTITAIVAHFRLSESGQASVGSVWTGPHEPKLVWDGLRTPQLENRYFAALIDTQSERQRLHDLARGWLSARCPGFFSPTEFGQPVVDFGAYTRFDPAAQSDDRLQGEPLRSIGVQDHYLFRNVSPQLPGAVLAQGDPLRKSNERLTNSWIVMGNLSRLREENDHDGYGDRPRSAATLGAILDEGIASFLLRVATYRYVSQLRETLGEARDTARARHRRFSPRTIGRLRDELLSISLDIPVISRDAALIFSRHGAGWHDVRVTAVPIDGIPNPPDAYDLIKRIGSLTKRSLKELEAEDAAYRDVLSTAASLGSSASQTRLAGRALYVAAASLVVSLVTLVVAISGPSLLQKVLDAFP